MGGRGRKCSRGSRGSTGRGHGHGQGQNYAGTTSVSKNGLCADLGNNVFDYRHKASDDHMRTSIEKLVQNVVTKYVKYISNEMHNKNVVNITEHVH